MKIIDKSVKEILSIETNLKIVMVNSDNTYYRDLLIQKASEKLFKGDYSYHDISLSETDLSVVNDLISMKSLMKSNKVIILRYSNKDMNKKIKVKKPKPKTFTTSELFESNLINCNNNVLLFMLPDKMDDKLNLHKYCSRNGKVIEFKQIDEKSLTSFINEYLEMNNIDIDDKSTKLLCNLIYPDLYMVKNELDKLVLFGEVNTKIINELITKSTELIMYEFIDNIVECNINKSIKMLSEMQSTGTSEFLILTSLQKHYKMLFYCKTMKNFSKEYHLPPFISRKYYSQCEKIKLKDIINAIELLIQLEIDLKGGSNKEIIIEYTILKLLKLI